MPHLLIVSPDPLSCSELIKKATDKGHRPKLVSDSPSAIQWLQTLPFDMLCVDVKIPKSTRLEVTKEFSKRFPGAPYFVFSFGTEDFRGLYDSVISGAEIAYGPTALETLEKAIFELRTDLINRYRNFEVLVVDDLDSPREILCSYVEGLGVKKVVGLSSAREALVATEAEPNRFGCILTDLRMPGVSGKDLIEIVRASPTIHSMPVVVLTAYGSADALVDCLKAGATGFLVKPPSKTDLANEVDRAFRIASRGGSARLVTPYQSLELRDALLAKGFI